MSSSYEYSYEESDKPKPAAKKAKKSPKKGGKAAKTTKAGKDKASKKATNNTVGGNTEMTEMATTMNDEPLDSMFEPEGVKKKEKIIGNVESDFKKTIQVKKFTRDAKDHLKDLVVYLVFLCLFTLVQYNSRTSIYAFRYNELMKDLFLFEEFPGIEIYKNYNDIATEEEMWDWVQGVLLPGLYSDGQVIYGKNYLLGTMRLRQVKVKPNDGCLIYDVFDGMVEDCYPAYDDDYIDTRPFGYEPNNTKAWKYQTESELDTYTTIARLEYYEGGGYVEEFSWSSSMYSHQSRIQTLRDEGWITVATRAVIIDFTTYNANSNIFHVAQCTLEFLPTGGVVPSFTFRVARLYKYIEPLFGILQEIGEIVLALYVLGYLVEEVYEWYVAYATSECLSYWTDVWNIADVVNIFLFIVAFIVRIVLWIAFDRLKFDATDPTRFYSFQNVSVLNSIEQNLFAINSLLLWFKVLKYTRFLPYFNVISLTIGKAVKNTAAFIVMAMFVIFGFAQAGWQALGTDVFGFHSFSDTFYTLLRMTLGDFDFIAMQYSNRVFGPFYFVVFTVLVFFVLLSMFLAILNDSYLEVMTEVRDQQARLDLVGYVRSRLADRYEWFRNREERVDKLAAAIGEEVEDDDLVSMDEVRAIFKKYEDDIREHLHVNSAEDLLKEFDVDGDAILDKAEQAELLRRLSVKKYQLTKQREALKWEHAEGPDFFGEVSDDSDGPQMGQQGGGRGLDTLMLNIKQTLSAMEKKIERMDRNINDLAANQ